MWMSMRLTVRLAVDNNQLVVVGIFVEIPNAQAGEMPKAAEIFEAYAKARAGLEHAKAKLDSALAQVALTKAVLEKAQTDNKPPVEIQQALVIVEVAVANESLARQECVVAERRLAEAKAAYQSIPEK
jgi:hypothetical protein